MIEKFENNLKEEGFTLLKVYNKEKIIKILLLILLFIATFICLDNYLMKMEVQNMLLSKKENPINFIIPPDISNSSDDGFFSNLISYFSQNQTIFFWAVLAGIGLILLSFSAYTSGMFYCFNKVTKNQIKSSENAFKTHQEVSEIAVKINSDISPNIELLSKNMEEVTTSLNGLTESVGLLSNSQNVRSEAILCGINKNINATASIRDDIITQTIENCTNTNLNLKKGFDLVLEKVEKGNNFTEQAVDRAIMPGISKTQDMILNSINNTDMGSGGSSGAVAQLSNAAAENHSLFESCITSASQMI